ncbi:ABC transporter substrate-binding protein [Burkholderiales bacterium GJ-E10]|nr:ABC transporter substrate-binding protein [Burkholderiales bacterium GJ-E10]
MKRSGLLRKMIGLLTMVAVLYAQSAAAACVWTGVHTNMPNPCAAGVGNASVTAAQMARGAVGAHCLKRDMGAPCVCPGHDASHTTVGAPSHPPLAHAAGAALLYIVTDMKTPAARRSVSPGIAPPIRAIPPPHSILHCVFLI